MISSLFKQWVSIFLMIALVVFCCVAVINKVWLSHPTIKVDNSIMDVGDVGIDITYLKDPLTNICYALISGSFSDSEIIFNGMILVPCDNLLPKGSR